MQSAEFNTAYKIKDDNDSNNKTTVKKKTYVSEIKVPPIPTPKSNVNGNNQRKRKSAFNYDYTKSNSSSQTDDSEEEPEHKTYEEYCDDGYDEIKIDFLDIYDDDYSDFENPLCVYSDMNDRLDYMRYRKRSIISRPLLLLIGIIIIIIIIIVKS